MPKCVQVATETQFLQDALQGLQEPAFGDLVVPIRICSRRRCRQDPRGSMREALKQRANPQAHRDCSLVPGLRLPAVLGADVQDVVAVVNVVPSEMFQLSDPKASVGQDGVGRLIRRRSRREDAVDFVVSPAGLGGRLGLSQLQPAKGSLRSSRRDLAKFTNCLMIMVSL
jgi:hypothetical protein